MGRGDIVIYVPDTDNYTCFVVQNEDVIRAYRTAPRNNATIDYRDYYLHSNYIYKDGQQTFSQYTTLPICLDNVTSDVYYRNDIADILIIFIILAFVCLYCPWKLFMRLFKKR